VFGFEREADREIRDSGPSRTPVCVVIWKTLTSPADPIQTTHTSLHPPAASQSRKQNREETVKQRRMERLAGCGAGTAQSYAHSDTFSLFLVSLPVLIISVLGRRCPPNIELVLIDQEWKNKPRQVWQHVSRGRGQIGCTDYLHYQGQASFVASGCVCLCVCVHACVCVCVEPILYSFFQRAHLFSLGI